MNISTRIVVRLFLSWASATFVGGADLRAESPSFQFAPRRLGSALLDGGWMVERSMGTVNGSPEFTFPLQLVYLNTRSQRGLFGDQWFCPQLESRILPRGPGVLLWQTPSGNMLPLAADKKRANEFCDPSEEWRAKVKGEKIEIANADGWFFLYKAGRLISLTSPTGRILEFTYKSEVVAQVILRDSLSNAARVLITATRDSKRRLESLEVCGLQNRFAYDRGPDGKLLSWTTPGQSLPERFTYGKTGVLAAIQPSSGETLKLVTQFFPPQRGEDNPDQFVKPEKKAANYRLLDDGFSRYSYANKTAGTSKFRVGAGPATKTISAENRQGGKQSMSIDQKIGAVTTKNVDGTSERIFFYLAPGQKYNGKIRRVERNDTIVAEYRYDKKTGFLIETQDQAGISNFYEYVNIAKPTRILRGILKEKELVSAMKYDAKGRLIETADAGNRTTRLSYNERGDLTAVTDPSGQDSRFSYDAYGRISGIQKAGQQQTVQYDNYGRVKTGILSDGQVTEYSYDNVGRVSSVKQNGVAGVAYSRDKAGRVTGKSDALGRTTTFERDSRGNLLAERKPNGSVTLYEYDSLNRRTAQIDGNGNRITFEYDAAGRMVKQKNALGQVLTWRYDEKGRLVRRTNGVQTVAWTYNDHNRLKKTDYGVPGEQIVYTYDAKGRTKRVATATNSVTYFYDHLNRVIARQLIRGQSERVVRYGWNSLNQKTSVTLSEKTNSPESKDDNSVAEYRLLQQTEYVYDPRGRLAELKSNGVSACQYRYDNKNRLIGCTYGNGIIASYSYDSFGRQTRLNLIGGPLVEPLVLAYEWDNAGQLLSRTWNKEKQLYTYDPSGQLLTVSEVQEIRESNADTPEVNGDGLTKLANQQNGPPSVSSVLERYRYDAAGNILSKFENGEETTMAYDAANQLVSSQTGGKTTAFKYDAAGRLESRSSGGDVQTWHYGFLDKVLLLRKPDGNQVAFDYYPDGHLAAKAFLSTASESAEAASEPAQKPASPLATLTAVLSESKLGGGDPKLSIQQKAMNQNIAEELAWDGLALLYRNGVGYAVEPHVSGGVPVVATQGLRSTPSYYINDILGTTLAVVSANRVEFAPMTAFGKSKGGLGAPRSGSEPATTAPSSPESNSLPQQNPSVPIKAETNQI